MHTRPRLASKQSHYVCSVKGICASLCCLSLVKGQFTFRPVAAVMRSSVFGIHGIGGSGWGRKEGCWETRERWGADLPPMQEKHPRLRRLSNCGMRSLNPGQGRRRSFIQPSADTWALGTVTASWLHACCQVKRNAGWLQKQNTWRAVQTGSPSTGFIFRFCMKFSNCLFRILVVNLVAICFRAYSIWAVGSFLPLFICMEWDLILRLCSVRGRK